MFFSNLKIPTTYVLIDTPRKLSWLYDTLVNLKTGVFSFDIETTDATVKSAEKIRGYKKTAKINVAGVSFAWGRDKEELVWKPGNAAYVPLIDSNDGYFWKGRHTNVIDCLKQIFSLGHLKVAHNGKFDTSRLLKYLGIEVVNFLFDTMLAHCLIDEERIECSHALKSSFDERGNIIKKGLVDVFLDLSGSDFKKDLDPALDFYDPGYRRFHKVPLDILYPYGCADSDFTLSLYFIFKRLLEKEGLIWAFNNIVMPLQEAIKQLEMHGCPLNIEKARTVEKEQLSIMLEEEKKIHELAGREFLVSSSEQLGVIIFDELGFALQGKRNKRGWVVDSDILKNIDHPIVEHVFKYRRASKINSTYVTAALERMEEVTGGGKIGWVHPDIFLDSLTGRLKCRDPNLTNLPRKENDGDIVKSIWECEDDYVFIFKDFSQMELRCLAHCSLEPSWVEGFNLGHDMHSAMALKIFNLDCEVAEVEKLYKTERSRAKTINFSIAYGKTIQSLAQTLGMTYEEAEKFIVEDYFGAAPVLKNWVDSVHEFAKKNLHVYNIFGRIRHLPDAGLDIPNYVKWPEKSETPECYRLTASPEALGINNDDIFEVDESKLKQQLSVKKLHGFKKCVSCKYLRSCFINGRIRHLVGRRNQALRQSVNSIIQGTAADMSSLALINITRCMHQHKVRSKPVLYIHDEIGCYTHKDDVEKAEKIMEYCMTERLRKITNFAVPIVTDTKIVKCWGDK